MFLKWNNFQNEITEMLQYNGIWRVWRDGSSFETWSRTSRVIRGRKSAGITEQMLLFKGAFNCSPQAHWITPLLTAGVSLGSKDQEGGTTTDWCQPWPSQKVASRPPTAPDTANERELCTHTPKGQKESVELTSKWSAISPATESQSKGTALGRTCSQGMGAETRGGALPQSALTPYSVFPWTSFTYQEPIAPAAIIAYPIPAAVSLQVFANLDSSQNRSQPEEENNRTCTYSKNAYDELTSLPPAQANFAPMGDLKIQ
ncbi:hypothetical protein C8R45DRAFT_1068979 [Mycena sanguinolenta]|nr:hypothetical protein C8R45DRAFT_1068979 [Mycena sanguinolenta]